MSDSLQMMRLAWLFLFLAACGSSVDHVLSANDGFGNAGDSFVGVDDAAVNGHPEAVPQMQTQPATRHLCHNNDEISLCKCSALRPMLGPSSGLAPDAPAGSGYLAGKGHITFLYEMTGTHWQSDSGGRGTNADWQAVLRKYLSDDWSH